MRAYKRGRIANNVDDADETLSPEAVVPQDGAEKDGHKFLKLR